MGSGSGFLAPARPRLLHPRAQGHWTPLPRAALPATARRQTAAGRGLCLGSGGASSMSSADRPPSQRLQLPFSSTATYQPDNNGVNFDIIFFFSSSGVPRHAAHHGCRKSFRSQGKHLLPFNPSSHSNPTSSIQGKVVLITGGKYPVIDDPAPVHDTGGSAPSSSSSSSSSSHPN